MSFLKMQYRYILKNRKTLFMLILVMAFSIYATIRIEPNIISLLAQSFLIYIFLIFFLYNSFVHPDYILGRFEHFIAHGFDIATLNILKSFAITSITFILIFLFVLFNSIFCGLTPIILQNILLVVLIFSNLLFSTIFSLNLLIFLQLKFNLHKTIKNLILLFFPVTTFKIYQSSNISLLFLSVICLVLLVSFNIILYYFQKYNNNELINHL